MPKPYLAILILGAIVAPQSAAGFFAKVEFSGIFESELAAGIVSSDARKAEFTLIPELVVNFGRTSDITVIGRLRSELADKLEPGKTIDIELREAFVDTEIGAAYLRAGKQQVVWGQADGLKVLDVLNPQSFREFILDDFDDSRIPLWMFNAEIPLGGTLLQLLWIPDNTYDDIPPADGTFAFSSPRIIPRLPAGLPVEVAPIARPDRVIKDSDVGAKLSAFVGGWDLSLNYAYHYFDRPVVRRTVSPAGITLRQNYERTHIVGGSLSNVFGDFTVRGEAAYSSDRFFLTDRLEDADGVIRAGEFSYVLGLDYLGWRDWFVSAQIFQSVLTETRPGLVRDRIDTSATLLIRRDFLNESLQAEALLIQNVNQGDGVLQAAIQYEWRSNLQLKIGADVFFGKSTGLFGQFNERDRVSIGFELGF